MGCSRFLSLAGWLCLAAAALGAAGAALAEEPSRAREDRQQARNRRLPSDVQVVYACYGRWQLTAAAE